MPKACPFKAEAKAKGLPTYFSGRPCSKGHIAPQYMNGGCKACKDLARPIYNEANKEKLNTWRLERYESVKDHISAQRKAVRDKKRGAPPRTPFSPEEVAERGCVSTQAYKQRNPEKVREYTRKRYAENRVELLAQDKIRRQYHSMFLTDQYVKQSFRSLRGIRGVKLPEELIELKRLSLAIQRELKKRNSK